MPLSIKHPEAERLARILAARTGETITQAITKALEERLLREEGKRKAANLSDELGGAKFGRLLLLRALATISG